MCVRMDTMRYQTHDKSNGIGVLNETRNNTLAQPPSRSTLDSFRATQVPSSRSHIKDIWVFTAASSDKAAALFIVILLETTPALGHY
jgi:hypothetical protein